MKNILLVGAALAALSVAAAAQAADLPSRRQAPVPASSYTPAPAFSWTGFYVGGNTGYGTGSFTKDGKGAFGSPSSGLLGLTAGYNYQIGQFVAGIEGDMDKSWLKSTSTLGNGRGYLTSNGSIRGRIGYAMDRALVYGTGGFAYGNVKASLATATPAFMSQNKIETGYNLGAGIEYSFTNNISAKAEYLYTALGAKNYFSSTDIVPTGLHYSTVRAGINYHF